MTEHAPMKLEKYYTCWIERTWHLPKKYPVLRLATGPLSVQCLNSTYDSIILTLVLEAAM